MEKLGFPSTAEEIRKPLEECLQMAGVRSPYLAPLPAPFPPVVMWSTCWNPSSILFVLNSNERYHSLVRDGIVVRRLPFDICCSSWSREYTGIHSSIGPDGYDSGTSIFRAFFGQKKNCLLADFFLSEIGGTLPPNPLTENHSAQKSEAELWAPSSS